MRPDTKIVPLDQSSMRPERCEPDWLMDRVAMLFAAYRKADYADPEGFVVQLGFVLEQYPKDIVEIITDPLTGIQRKLKFPPAMAEIVAACEDWLRFPIVQRASMFAKVRAQNAAGRMGS